MAIVKTQGVVTKRQNLRDTSLIVTFFTRDFGRLKAVAKGARSKGSKFQSGLDLFAHGQLVAYLKDDRDLQLLSDFDVIHSFAGLQSDLRRFAHAGAAGELLEALTAGQDPSPELFDRLVELLGLLETAHLDALSGLFRAYQLKTCELLGYRPELERCANCGKTAGLTKFSPQMGGVVCSACALKSWGSTPLSHRILDRFKFLSRTPLKGVSAAAGDPSEDGEVGRMMDAFLQYHVERYRGSKSLQLVRKLGAARGARSHGGSAQ
jgi:DNA repair protein RecO (recombination protein O)